MTTSSAGSFEMKASHYTVKAELKKFWFNPSKIVYVLEEHREAWYDPSCGAGAGEYRPYAKIIDKNEDLTLIQDLCDILNKHNGEIQ